MFLDSNQPKQAHVDARLCREAIVMPERLLAW